MPIEQKKMENGNIGGKEPKIFAMPEKFLGVLPGNKVQEEAPLKTVKTPVNPPASTKVETAPLVKGSGIRKKLIMAGIAIFILTASGAAIYFFVLPKLNQTAQIPTPPKEENIPTAPSINEEIPEETVATTTPEDLSATSTIPVEEEGIHNGLDSDGDGLTDAEEDVYGAVVSNPDTDIDGFLDGHEVFHLYNPAGTSPEKLIDTGAVKNYKNDKDGYQIYYPAKWTIGGLGSGGIDGTIINSGTGEFVSIITEQNINNLPIISWYLDQAPGIKAGEIQTFVTKSNFDGIKSPDGFNAYFTKGGMVYIISYNIGTKVEINYKRTFEMMLNSFRIDR